MINIYCDESCHLPNDNIPVMVIGGISCPKNRSRSINEKLRTIKRKYGVFEYAEIKWVKVSPSKINMYKEMIDLFFDHSFLKFRAVAATGKQRLDLESFNLSYDDWYQRIYYLVLKEMIEIGETYGIYVDIKDTKGDEKVKLLRKVLNRTLYDFYDDTVQNIQLVRSDQIQILQLTDLLIGAISHAQRNLKGSAAKAEIISYIEQKIHRPLTIQSHKSECKFNLFIWQPRE